MVYKKQTIHQHFYESMQILCSYKTKQKYFDSLASFPFVYTIRFIHQGTVDNNLEPDLLEGLRL